MARQVPTMAELDQVLTDLETFFLPFDASLDLGTRTVYGTTDPEVDLSMVNVRHLNNTRGFRGVWATAPADGNEPAPYLAGQVVLDSNGLIYQRNATAPATNPDPEMTGQTAWDLIGREVTVMNQDSSATVPPGLSTTESGNTRTITFSRYRGGNGVDVNNTTGEISVTNFSLTDVHTFTTVALRNAANTIEWHIGDIAIVTSNTDNGQGTYVYTGTTNGNDFMGTTVAADWVLLALPGNVVTSVADTVGPTVTTQNIVDAINADTFTDGQILTEAQATRVGSRYSGAGAPAGNFASGTRLTGDVYVDTTNNNFYFFDGSAWMQANPAELDDVGDVTITTATENDLLIRNNSNTWVNTTIRNVSGMIQLEDLSDVDASPTVGDLLIRTAESGTDRWDHETIAQVISGANHGVGATLENLTNVADGAPASGDLLRYDGTNWERIATLSGTQITDATITGAKLVADTITAREIAENAVTASELANDAVDTAAIVDLNVTTAKLAADAVTNAKLADNAVQTENITDLNVTTGKLADDAVTNAKVADDAIALDQLADVTGLNAGDRRILIYSQDTGAWAYVAPEEQAIGSIFDIGDVQFRQDIVPMGFALPADPASVRLTANQVTSVDSGETPPDDTAIVGLMSTRGLAVGDRIGFVNAAGTAIASNGTEGFNVAAVNPNGITISDVDGDVIPTVVRENIAASAQGEVKFPFLFERTGGTPEPVIQGELLSYNATSMNWENNTPGELNIINDLQVGEGSNQQAVPITDAQAIILEATPERDGAMSSEDKLKLDNIPTAPTTVAGNTEPTMMDPNITLGDTEHYALSVERTSSTGPAEYAESWVNITDIVTSGGSPLIWRDAADTNSTDLVQYRQGSAIRNIVGTAFSGNFLRLSLGVFTPTLNDGTLSRSWDQPANSIIASVTNPPGVDQFISSVDAITLDSGNAQTLPDFTPGTMTPTAGPDVDWTQPFTLTSGNIFDNNTGSAGGTTIATITFNERTGTGPEARYAPDTSTYSINWGSVSATSPSASLARSNINFYERVTSVAVTQSLFGLRTASNGSITWTRGAGLTGGTLTGTTRLNSTFTLGSPVYKDSRTIAADATVASSVIATRPATVTGTEYMQTLSTATSNRPAITSVTMPFFRLTTDALSSTPTPYGPDDGILTGDFDTGDGLTLAPGILRATSVGGLNLGSATSRVTVPADTFYWFGRQGTTAPTIQVDTGVGLQDPVGTVTHTVTFDNSFTNAPSGWTSVTYTFIGVSVNAGPTYINVT